MIIIRKTSYDGGFLDRLFHCSKETFFPVPLLFHLCLGSNEELMLSRRRKEFLICDQAMHHGGVEPAQE